MCRCTNRKNNVERGAKKLILVRDGAYTGEDPKLMQR
jgi:hypothetical protein